MLGGGLEALSLGSLVACRRARVGSWFLRISSKTLNNFCLVQTGDVYNSGNEMFVL